MEVQKIGEGSPTEIRWTTAQQVQRLAEENAAAQLKTRGVPVAVTPINTEDKKFSPAIYAQAAQFQLYTQSGTLAAMLSQVGAAAVTAPAPTPDKGNAIPAVQKLNATQRFDTKA